MENNDDKKIIQLIPVDNWWIKYISNEDREEGEKIKYHYGRVAFFALCESKNGDQDIIPIDFDESGYWELDCNNRDGWFHSLIRPVDD